MKNKITALSLVTLFGLTACTAQVQTSVGTPAPSPTASPTSTPSASPNPTTTAAPTATKTPSPKPTQSAKAEVKSETTINSNTDINISSNGTNVEIVSRNGKRYAKLNGKEVELDANGCYDYDQNGTKIHACVNN